MKARRVFGLLAFAWALSVPRAEEAPSGSTVADTARMPSPARAEDPAPASMAEPSNPSRDNRLLFHPVTSFVINGVNGRYERRFAGHRLGLGVPFYLGRETLRNVGSEFTWGGGLALTLFRTPRIQTARFTVSADWVDVRRLEQDFYYSRQDPTFPSTGGDYDVYHLYAYSASILVGYRWEYPSVPFTVDLDFGATAMGTSQPQRDVLVYGYQGTKLGYYSGVYPVVQFSVGVPF
jgi:hypothetical protein